MGTSITEVIDLFTMIESDYRLDALYQTSGSDAFNNYIEGWLIYAINEFTPYCKESLVYSTTTQTFTATLSSNVITILANLMIKYWLQKEVQDIRGMRAYVQDRDFSTHSAAQNLKSKMDFLNSKREELSQLIQDYSLQNVSWQNWNNQIFGSG